MNFMNKLAIIGGGASGMMAAISAASDGAKVILIEQKELPGKKILVTGNGRCNYTNLYQTPECYRSDQPEFAWKILEQFPAEQAVEFFQQAGIFPKDRNGYLYPNSDQAASVREVLEMEVRRLGVELHTETVCKKILPVKQGFKIQTDKGIFSADKVILCAGSKAAPQTGSDGSGYALAKGLGHSLVPVLPALVQLKCGGKFFKNLAGVRANGKVSLCVKETENNISSRQAKMECPNTAEKRTKENDEGSLSMKKQQTQMICLAEDTGELQLTAYGISGIPVFQVSRYAARALYEKKEVFAFLDFMPEMSKEEFYSYLENRAKMRPEKTAEEFFTGLFHKKLADLWIKFAKIPKTKQAGDFTEQELQHLTWLIKEFKVAVTGTNSFDQAQICCGGVDTREVDEATLESKIVPGLYFAGELLDVDGICGGYNLTWAWSSGFVAGREAAKTQS